MGSIPALPNFAALTVGSATALNQLRDAVNFWALPPRCLAYRSTNQAIPNGMVATAVSMDSEVYDIFQTGDTEMHTSDTPTRIYIRTPGKYEVGAQLRWSSGGAGTIRIARIILNGTTLLCEDARAPLAGTSTTTCTPPPTERHLNVGDYIELVALHDGTAPLDIVGGTGVNFLRVRLTAA